jgi:hypothetical protein
MVYEHVYGHQDTNIPWILLTLLQQLNTIADQLAKDALWRAFASGQFVSSNFPFESFQNLINGRKVTSSIRDALYKQWGYEAAKDLFEQRKIVSPSNFDLICWDAVSEAMLVYPRMFRVCVTKTVSHFCGSNLQLERFRESTTDACPCFGTPNESAVYITRCRNTGCTDMFEESVSLFIDWLNETHMQEDLILCIESYLLLRGDESMVYIASHLPLYASFAKDVDALGWECFLDLGRPNTHIPGHSPACLSPWQHTSAMAVLQRSHQHPETGWHD